jgi:hypothetical protein
MRIVVSGTHATGKSTLITDFVRQHSEFTVLPDPFELLDEAWDSPNPAMFTAQLRIAADRLVRDDEDECLIAERGPIDFLAYLLAMAELTGSSLSDDLIERATTMSAAALRTVDLLVVLPLAPSDPIHVGDEEYPELRDAMNDMLLDLIDDPDVIGTQLTVAEITGDPAARLTALEALVGEHASRPTGEARGNTGDVERQVITREDEQVPPTIRRSRQPSGPVCAPSPRSRDLEWRDRSDLF